METVTLPEQYSEQIKTIAGYPIRVTSYRLWDTSTPKLKLRSTGWADGLLGQKEARRLEPKQG